MACLSTTLKVVFPFSPFVKQHKPVSNNNNNNNALFTYHHTSNSTNSHLYKRGDSFHKKQNDVPVPVEISWRIPLSEVVAVRKKSAFWERSWNFRDVRKLVIVGGVHLLSLLAPFHFNWSAFRLCLWLSVIFGICITFSYHRNLSHRSFDLPKWLEYLFAYGGVLAFQGAPIEWVSNHRYHHKHCDTQRDPHSPTQGFWFSHMTWIFDTGSIVNLCGGYENANDLVRDPFYRFLHRTFVLHLMAYALLLYVWAEACLSSFGELPESLIQSNRMGQEYSGLQGVATVARYHATFLGTSVCHIWGTRAWNTPDFSKNNWWVSMLTLGEGWHNNHHAFQFSARHGLEWWQLDVTWYLIRFLEAIGLATNVKLPTQAQKKRMALV